MSKSATPPVIAIDGPAASGKSTTAAAVARALGVPHLDSGSLYRALTVLYLEGGADRGTEGDPVQRALRLAAQRELGLREIAGSLVPFLDGRDVERLLRSSEVNAVVSEVSAEPAIREWVNVRLRAAAATGSRRALVLDGRDIGTAVFPDAPVKVFLTASPEARARRRLLQRGSTVDAGELAREAEALATRDRKDSTRHIAPLRPAEDAVVLDTTELDFSEQVAEIVRLARSRLPELSTPDRL